MLSFALAAVMAMPIVAVGMGTAHADRSVRVRVGGSVSVHVRTHKRHKRVRVRVKRHRTNHAHYRLRIGGSISFGAGVSFSEPPPPPAYECEPDPIPAYYSPAPPPAPVVTTVVGHYQSELPRWGVGVYAGSVDVQDRPYGSDLGILGRLRLNRTGSLQLEGELAKTEHDDGSRVDKRAGAALLWDLSPRSRLSPYLLVGAGMSKVDVDGWNADQDYGEVGAGLTYRLTDRLHLSGDLRAGARTAVDGAPEDAVMKAIAPSADENENYTRGRISAVLFF